MCLCVCVAHATKLLWVFQKQYFIFRKKDNILYKPKWLLLLLGVWIFTMTITRSLWLMRKHRLMCFAQNTPIAYTLNQKLRKKYLVRPELVSVATQKLWYIQVLYSTAIHLHTSEITIILIVSLCGWRRYDNSCRSTHAVAKYSMSMNIEHKRMQLFHLFKLFQIQFEMNRSWRRKIVYGRV